MSIPSPYKAMTMNDDRRIQYRSLSEAIHNTSQPDFDPWSLASGPNNDPTYLGSAKLSSTSRLPAGSTDFPAKSPPFNSLKTRAAKLAKLGKSALASDFEVPEWRKIYLHTALCLVSYPTLLGVVFIARNKSIFWTRFIIGVACGFIGLCLGYSLLTLAKSHLEAASRFYRRVILDPAETIHSPAWATVIHQSHFDASPGVRLRDLAATTDDPTSALTALRLLWNRKKHPATAQRSRQNYE
ncbi:hypothetical protein C0992_007115 [Termitomyces sp. T32_za158]|nr:hypothetical protein C0992_007115 [Termitomyces sp. T32_za158]